MDVLDIQSFENNLIHNSAIYTYTDGIEMENYLSPTQLELTNTQISKSISPSRNLQQAISKRKQEQKTVKRVTKWDELKFVSACQNGRINFSEQNLQRLNLEGGQLNKYIFRHAQLQEAIFMGANLSQANFYGANLSQTNFKKANLRETYFSKSNLQDASFQSANLCDADFTNANLKGVNLCGANLKNAKINQEQLENVKINWTTIFPDGSRHWWKFF